jgi:hypothetical protein
MNNPPRYSTRLNPEGRKRGKLPTHTEVDESSTSMPVEEQRKTRKGGKYPPPKDWPPVGPAILQDITEKGKDEIKMKPKASI